MKVIVRGKQRHDKHRLRINTWHEPENWFEKYILRRREKIVVYVGAGTKWYVMTLGKTGGAAIDFTPVTNKSLIFQLSKI